MDSFNYLGITITSKGEKKIEIQERISEVIKCIGGLLYILRSKKYRRKYEK